ncbi:hypothetical protein F2P81_004727 [Scophthalmus maximus]|uniref:Ion transport domain-containing protein n=1 Tax=Scophthalmus maximus TaxID=52904 RepID=A0A6A4TI27_SCOMX|nr:hypothetical protein F2P81_004727 [Scophthalmus maximus]
MANAEGVEQAGLSDLEIISQPVEDENQCLAPPVQLVSFGYRDLPLAALDLSLAGSQLLSNADEDEIRDGQESKLENKQKSVSYLRDLYLHPESVIYSVGGVSNQSAAGVLGLATFLLMCCDQRCTGIGNGEPFKCKINYLQSDSIRKTQVQLAEAVLRPPRRPVAVSNAFQFASIIHWISLIILSLFFSETVFRIVVLGIWDYIENKVEVFDGAVIVLSLAPMVASTVANGPSSPWDAISLIITLRIWRVKRIIDAYVLQVKVEMELEIQQCEKTKAVREEQLERLTQICQEQARAIQLYRTLISAVAFDDDEDDDDDSQEIGGFEHLRVLNHVNSNNIQDPVGQDDMNNYISQYYSEASSDAGASGLGTRVITMAAIDVHLPTNTNPIQSNPMLALERVGSAVSDASASMLQSSGSLTVRPHSLSSHTPASSMTDCSSSSTAQDLSLSYSSHRCCPPSFSGQDPRGPSMVVQELLSSLSEDPCLAQKGLAVDPVNLKLPSPTGSEKASPELDNRINIFNRRNQEERRGRGRGRVLLQTRPLIHLQGGTTEPSLEEKYRLLGPADTPLGHMPDT